jgi:uncharacterized cupredoxin-like copper-binding protein
MAVLSIRGRRPTLARARSLALIAAIALIGGACGGTLRPQASGQVVRISERDFTISAPRTIAAGDVTLRVTNTGPDHHELLVARLQDGRLPMRSDGMTVDEGLLARRDLPGLEPGGRGAVRDLHLHLRPGRYLLFCNMSGHYLGGMQTVLVVR